MDWSEDMKKKKISNDQRIVTQKTFNRWPKRKLRTGGLDKWFSGVPEKEKQG